MPNFKVEKDFMINDYRCVVLGTSMGHRCGYVGLPKGHDLEGVYYGKIDVDVHGGLTFGRENENYPVENAEKRWYIGFDCAHCYDIIDTQLLDELLPEKEAEEMKSIYDPLVNPLRNTIGGHLWTTEDVENELRNLVEQLKNYSEKMDVI